MTTVETEAASSELPAKDSDFALIATVIGNNNIIQMRITKLLSENNIDCYFHGSVGYGLCVRASDATKAAELSQNLSEISEGEIEFRSEYLPSSLGELTNDDQLETDSPPE